MKTVLKPQAKDIFILKLCRRGFVAFVDFDFMSGGFSVNLFCTKGKIPGMLLE